MIIQARMNSIRLPGKVMLPLCGEPVLGQLISRIQRCRHAIDLLIATTVNQEDDVIADFCKDKGLAVYRGDEADVLARYYYAALQRRAETVIRVTADCPLYDAGILDEMLEAYTATPCDYLSNVLLRTYPRGLDTEIFSFQALERCFLEAKEQPYREHVTPYMYEEGRGFRIENYVGERDYTHLRWTLDTPEDYILISQIYDYLYPRNKAFQYADVLSAYEQNPHWIDINREVKQRKVWK